jgi:RHS Repeat
MDAIGTTAYGYDALNHLKTETPPAPYSPTAYTYDRNGNLMTITDSWSGSPTSYQYMAVNMVRQVTDPENHATTFTYADGSGRDKLRTGTSFPNGVTENALWDDSKRPKEISATGPGSPGPTLFHFQYFYDDGTTRTRATPTATSPRSTGPPRPSTTTTSCAERRAPPGPTRSPRAGMRPPGAGTPSPTTRRTR